MQENSYLGSIQLPLVPLQELSPLLLQLSLQVAEVPFALLCLSLNRTAHLARIEPEAALVARIRPIDWQGSCLR